MGRLVELFEKEEYNKAVKDYFRDGLLTIDTIAEWSNTKFILELLNENLITYDDLIRLEKENKIDKVYFNDICNIKIHDSEIEYIERLKLLKTGLISEDQIVDLYNKNLLFEKDFEELAEEGHIRKTIMQKAKNSRTLKELEKNSAIKLIGLNDLTKKNHHHNNMYSGGTFYNGFVSTGKVIIDPSVREDFIRLLGARSAITDLQEDSPFYNYEFYVLPNDSETFGLDSVVIAERYYEDKETKIKFATNNATYFFRYKDLMVLSNLKKSEMTKERENVVFTSNHGLAIKNRKGSWASSVLTSVARTAGSSGVKTKKGIREKLSEMYSSEELKNILTDSLFSLCSAC